MIIAIDGPAGSGKSTVAELLAQKLGFLHFNSGLLYRAVASHFLKIGYDFSKISTYSKVPSFKIKVQIIDNAQHVFVNNEDLTNSLTDNNVSIHAPIISVNKKVREKIDACQKKFVSKNDVVIDGRDIGSFVFPNAEYKFYLDCDLHERAKRRFKDAVKKNPNITLKEIEQQLDERDKIDKSKKIAPLVIPKGAIIVDSTNMTIDQVVDTIAKNINV
ncbi:MAG: (d)CMP kinase [Candidatus Onthoplasma sp.]